MSKKFERMLSDEQKDYLKLINSSVSPEETLQCFLYVLDCLRSYERVFIKALAVSIAAELERRKLIEN